jgi:hypothetical protein
MAVDPRGLSECMLYFKNNDPPQYERFLGILREYVDDITVAVTTAPVDAVLVAQGRAQQAHKFLNLFTELVRGPNSPSP